MPGREVLISIAPSSLTVAAPVSTGYRTDRTPLDPAAFEQVWQQGLVPLAAPLEAALARLGVGHRARADVVYHGPDVQADLFSLPGSPGDARRAARLALSEGFPGGLGDHPSEFVVLGRDGAGPELRTHVLGVADRDERVQAICDLVRRVGCLPRDVVPGKALKLADAVMRAMKLEAPSGGGVVHLGDHATVIVGIADQRLRAARLIGFGHDLLTDAIRRAARTVSADHGPAWRAAIADALLESGIPGRGEAFPAVEGLTGAAILPLAQPVIQRLTVEVKQTFRFALNFSELSRVTILLTGSGSRIPRLAAVISEMLDARVIVAGGERATPGLRPDSDLDLLVRHRALSIGLTSGAESRQAEAGRARTGVRAGACLSAAVIGAVALFTAHQQGELTRESAGLAPAIQAVHEREQLLTRAESLEMTLASETRQLSAALRPAADWGAVLADLAENADPLVRLTGFQGASGVAGLSVALQGVVMLSGAADGPDPLGIYIEKLSRSPLFAAVELGPTRTSEFDGRPARVFSLTLKLHPLPDRDLRLAGETGGQP